MKELAKVTVSESSEKDCQDLNSDNGWEYNSVVRTLPRMHKALGSIPNNAKEMNLDFNI